MNTLLIRLESHLQSYSNMPKFGDIKTEPHPTKSAVMGMMLAAHGICRDDSREALAQLNQLSMGVRIDQPGTIIHDFQTIRPPLTLANGKVRETGDITRRTYVSDASFLVALQGDSNQVNETAEALKNPNFPLFLGRSFCIPYRSLFEGIGKFDDLETALKSVKSKTTSTLKVVLEQRTPDNECEMVHDVLVDCRNQLFHTGRCVKQKLIDVEVDAQETSRNGSKKMDAKVRAARFAKDNYMCVVCKMRASEAHHVTYIRYGHERIEDLRSLCENCHKAVTSLEYTLGMYSVRIDPLQSDWVKRIRQVRCNMSL